MLLVFSNVGVPGVLWIPDYRYVYMVDIVSIIFALLLEHLYTRSSLALHPDGIDEGKS